MSFFSIVIPLSIVEVAAKHESQHPFLLEAVVMDALEYACAHDFIFIGVNVAAYSAGGLVALVGRNEGGKTLSREAVKAIVWRAD